MQTFIILTYLVVLTQFSIVHVFVRLLQVGVISDTEGGKKALVSALLRLVEPTGVVRIDGIDIMELGLHDLRSKIAFVPQVTCTHCRGHWYPPQSSPV